MSFTLRVSFHGMCLFVRDGTQALHVLMPATGGAEEGDGCGCVEQHSPRLIFDSAYLRPQQTGLDDALVHCSMLNKALEFPQAGNALDNTLPAGLAKVGEVRADVLDGTNTDLVSARVLLRNGSLSDYAKGDCWTWQGQLQRLSHIIEWSITDVPGDSLSLSLQGLSGAFAGSVPTLHPVDGVVEVEVWHAPHTELPPDYIIPPPPAARGGAQHFSSYGKLLQAGTVDLPEYEPDACLPITNPGKYDDGPKSSVTYSCVSAEGFKP
ncbi:hypothetical protein [Longimicrobium sp.]|uniref:hypothetical protein n=1 Tax=Longimicrobium sp. TaxID=2029185 RepID=UPI002C5CE815|nr:hypothetical protein [Longimicrobium sp.]HSU13465.1 hypothetical protein [Longimicrobium sp.]